jgi:hypothetical protein
MDIDIDIFIEIILIFLKIDRKILVLEVDDFCFNNNFYYFIVF